MNGEQGANPLLPCGHLFIGGSRCRGRPEWHDGALGKHPYKPIDRRSGTDRRRRSMTVAWLRARTIEHSDGSLWVALDDALEAATPDRADR